MSMGTSTLDALWVTARHELARAVMWAGGYTLPMDQITIDSNYAIVAKEVVAAEFPGVATAVANHGNCEGCNLFEGGEVFYLFTNQFGGVDLHVVVDHDYEVYKWDGVGWDELENWMADGGTRSWLYRHAKKHGLVYTQE